MCSRLTAGLLLALLFGCERRDGATGAAATGRAATPGASESAAAASAVAAATPVAIAHGGAGSPVERSSAVVPAARAALSDLAGRNDALAAAVAGAVVLEDDASFNAGTGANVRFDGVSVQMDAAVMDSKGRFGAVAVIERVKNPVQIARAVIDTPHSLIAGDGATAFARALGVPDYDPITPEARAKRDKALSALRGEGDAALPPGWRDFDWKRHYEYQRRLRDAGVESSDTIGVLVRSARGEFAGALSTGGTTLTLRGRVGDVPLAGAGLYVGARGAVACTGNGEDIVREMLARRVYDRIAGGQSAAAAARWGVALFSESVPIGVIALDSSGDGAAANRSMAWAAADSRGERLAK